ncbi:terminase large subunit [Anabaena phage Elbi]|nr:terminase large subunit [Anabaena phage Elbi]
MDFPIVDSYHPKQGNIVARGIAGTQNSILVCGRGFGKSIAGRGIIYTTAIDYRGMIPPQGKTKLFNVIAMPHLNQAKKIHWSPLEYLFTETDLSRLVKNINRSEGTIELIGSLPGIALAGLNDDNGNKIRGWSIPRLVIDEMQDVKPGIWASIKPAVDRCLGRVFVSGTPKGKGTPFHRFCKDMTAQGWKYYHYFTEHNPFLPDIDRVLAEARQALTEREFNAEYRASWEDFPGQIFDQLQPHHVLPPESLPNSFDSIVMGIDWGDIHPAIAIVGIRDFPYKYYLIDFWQGNPYDTSNSISMDLFIKTCGEYCDKYGVHSTYPDVFQPGNINNIYEFRNSEWGGMRNIVDPDSGDYQRMRTLRVMPSLSLMNRLFSKDRLFIHKDIEDQFRSIVRKQDKISGQFIDEVDKQQGKHHIIDGARYCIANIENAMQIFYGFNQVSYSPFDADQKIESL